MQTFLHLSDTDIKLIFEEDHPPVRRRAEPHLAADDDPRWTPWVQYETHLGGVGCCRTKIAGRLTG